MAKKEKEIERLAQEATAALAQGVSYGKYKAMQKAEPTKKAPHYCTMAAGEKDSTRSGSWSAQFAARNTWAGHNGGNTAARSAKKKQPGK